MADLAPKRFTPFRIRIAEGNSSVVPKLAYEADHELGTRDEQIRRVFVSLHGTGGDAIAYYDNGRAALERRDEADPGTSAETFLIAPQFFNSDEVTGSVPDDVLYWDGGRASGNLSGNVTTRARNFRIRSFDVMDSLITELCRPENFPNLRIIVLVGHSNGGRFLARYAAANPVEDRIARPRGVHVRYLVMGAGSYLYMGEDRYRFTNDSYLNVLTSNQWKDAIVELQPSGFGEVCSTDAEQYNTWPWGLDSLWNYPNQFGAERIRNQFGPRDVIYLVGENDLSTSFTACPERVQGRDTLAKALLYAHHLQQYYGDSYQHRLRIAAGIGHSGRDEMRSPEGQEEIFRARPNVGGEGTMVDDSDLMVVYGTIRRLQVEQVGTRAQLRCNLDVEGGGTPEALFAYLDGSDAAVVQSQLDVLRDAFNHQRRIRLRYNDDEGDEWKRFYDVRVYR